MVWLFPTDPPSPLLGVCSTHSSAYVQIQDYIHHLHNSKRPEVTKTRNNLLKVSPVDFTFLLKNLQWLPIAFRIQSKFLYQASTADSDTNTPFQISPNTLSKDKTEGSPPKHHNASSLPWAILFPSGIPILHTSKQPHPTWCAHPGSTVTSSVELPMTHLEGAWPSSGFLCYVRGTSRFFHDVCHMHKMSLLLS